PNCSRNFSIADSVCGSSPYPTTCPWLARPIASSTSACTTALLSLAKLRLGFMTQQFSRTENSPEPPAVTKNPLIVLRLLRSESPQQAASLRPMLCLDSP